MTELNWLKLSGLMHRCIYSRKSVNCPFNEFRNKDNIEQFQLLDKIGNSLGMQMLSACSNCRKQNMPIENKDLVIRNSRHFRVVG